MKCDTGAHLTHCAETMASEMYHLITKQVKQPDEFANSFNVQGGALSEVRPEQQRPASRKSEGVTSIGRVCALWTTPSSSCL